MLTERVCKRIELVRLCFWGDLVTKGDNIDNEVRQKKRDNKRNE